MLAEHRTPVRSGESWQTLALLTDVNDAAYTQSGISAVTCSVYDESSADPTENLWVSAQPAKTAVFFDTLQANSGWDLPVGFNFKHIVHPADLNAAINAGHAYRVRYDVETVLHGNRVILGFFVVVA